MRSQFRMGFSALSITIISTGTFRASNRRPSCSCSARAKGRFLGSVATGSAAPGGRPARRARSRARPIDTGGHSVGTRAAAQYVAEQKIASGDPLKNPWKNMREVEHDFQTVRERAGEVAYREGLERYGWCDFKDIRKALDSRDAATKAEAKQRVTDCYRELDAMARKEGK